MEDIFLVSTRISCGGMVTGAFCFSGSKQRIKIELNEIANAKIDNKFDNKFDIDPRTFLINTICYILKTS